MAAKEKKLHKVKIRTAGGKVECDPKTVKPDVHHLHDIKWECDDADAKWAVVFGPDSPFEKRVIGQGLMVDGLPAATHTTVKAHRPGDFHKHKYVAIVLVGDQLVACDPEVDVEEEEEGGD